MKSRCTSFIGSELLESRRLLAGELDPTFGGGDGIVVTDFTGNPEQARAVALYPDGRIVAAGFVPNGGETGTDWAIARYLPDGTLDTTFSGDGRIVENVISTIDRAYAVAIQPDGKALVGGYVFNPTNSSDDVAVLRYNEDGTLDPTFGVGGKAIIDLSDVPQGSADQAYAMALQEDGKIVLAGGSARFGQDPQGQNLIVARVNPNGTLDTGFGAGGSVRSNYNAGFGGNFERARGVVIYPDGRIATAGETRGQTENSYDFILARYTSEGVPDTSFGTRGDGLVITEFFATGNSEEHAFDLALQTDGKLVAGGSAFERAVNGSRGHQFALARYDLDGRLDPTFDGDGLLTTDIEAGEADIGRALAIQPDGRIVMVGASLFTGQFATTERNGDLDIVRYERDGNIDVSFGAGGVVNTNFQNYFADGGYDVLVQPDGKVLLAGEVQTVENQSQFTDFLLERFNGDGATDFDAPRVTSMSFDAGQPQHAIRFAFDDDVSASIDRADLQLVNLNTGEVFSSAGVAVTYDSKTNTATFTFPGALNGRLAETEWRASLHRSGVFDDNGNRLALRPIFDFTFIVGDADSNGQVDFDDYARIDNGFNNHLIGYRNGDFNYDGRIDFDDYSLIDAAFNRQFE